MSNDYQKLIYNVAYELAHAHFSVDSVARSQADTAELGAFARPQSD